MYACAINISDPTERVELVEAIHKWRKFAVFGREPFSNEGVVEMSQDICATLGPEWNRPIRRLVGQPHAIPLLTSTGRFGLPTASYLLLGLISSLGSLYRILSLALPTHG